MAEINSKIIEMEIKLYRNPRGSDNIFYSDNLVQHYNKPSQLNMLTNIIQTTKRHQDKLKSIEQLNQNLNNNQLCHVNLKVINVGVSGKEGFKLQWIDLDQCMNVTDEYKVYDHQVMAVLKQLCNQPVEETNKSNIQYSSYNDECLYCFQSGEWYIRDNIKDNNNSNNITDKSSALDPDFTPHKSQCLNVPEDESSCTCAPYITIIHHFSLTIQ